MDMLLFQRLQQLNYLKELTPDWDGYGASPPDTEAIDQASLTLQQLFKFFDDHAFYSLKFLNITASSEGEVVFEWWVGDKKLTIYVSSAEIIYIKVGGERIEDMEDGILELQDMKQLSDLFQWIHRQ